MYSLSNYASQIEKCVLDILTSPGKFQFRGSEVMFNVVGFIRGIEVPFQNKSTTFSAFHGETPTVMSQE